MRRNCVGFLMIALVFACLGGFLAASEIKSGKLRLGYSKETGQVTDIRLLRVFKKKLNIDNSFDVLVQKEGEPTGKWIPFSEFKLTTPVVTPRGKSVVASYSNGAIKVETTTSAEADNSVHFKIKVVNGGSIPILRVRYPNLKNISFSPGGENDELLWPLRTTMLIKNPSNNLRSISVPQLDPVTGVTTKMYPWLHYPRATQNYIDISGADRGLTLIGDPSLIMNQYGLEKSKQEGALDVRIDMLNSIASGESAEYEFILYPHKGNWKRGADFYREHFYKIFPKPQFPDWVKYTNGYLAVYEGFHFGPPYGKNTRIYINETWRLGLSHLQFWGQTGNHACPGYPLADPLRGGEEGIAKMFKQIRDADVHAGGHIWGCGINKFEVLSSSYRGVKWSDLPEEVRPPSWDLIVKNSLYRWPDRKAPTKKFTSNSWKRISKAYKVNTVAEVEAKKLTPQQLHNMDFQSKWFRDWLDFWVRRYVNKYNCDVPYLDVYGHRPKYVSYNPYLKKWGDGTEGQLRLAFLRKTISDLRKTKKDMIIFIEGTLDAYNTLCPSLVSGNRKFMEGRRYSQPGAIFYEGMANGWWSYTKSNIAISNAYLDGNRYDLMFQRPRRDTEQMVWVRDSFIPWVADGRYIGMENFVLSSNKVQGVLIDGDDVLGSSLINFRNAEKLPGQSARLKKTFAKKYACGFLVPLFGGIRLIDDLTKPIIIPKTMVSSLLLVRETKDNSVLPFVLPEMTARGLRFNISLVNPGNREAKVSAVAELVEKGKTVPVWDVTLAPRQVARKKYVFPKNLVSDKVERVRFNFTGCVKKTFRRAYTPLVEDPGFEWNPDLPLSVKYAQQGKRSLEIKGGTREKAFLKLAPETDYEIKIDVFKLPGSGPNIFIWDSRQRKVISRFRGTSSLKYNEWGTITAKFNSREDCSLYVTMKNGGAELLYCDNIRIKASR